MVMKCIVCGCSSEWHPGCDKIFHSFPSNKTERDKWLEIVPLKRPFFERAKICSLHFKATDYEFTGKRLKRGVIPSFQVENSSSIETKENQDPSALPSYALVDGSSNYLNKKYEGFASEVTANQHWEAILDMESYHNKENQAPSALSVALPTYTLEDKKSNDSNRKHEGFASEVTANQDWEAIIDMESCHNKENQTPSALSVALPTHTLEYTKSNDSNRRHKGFASEVTANQHWEAILDIDSCHNKENQTPSALSVALPTYTLEDKKSNDSNRRHKGFTSDVTANQHWEAILDMESRHAPRRKRGASEEYDDVPPPKKSRLILLDILETKQEYMEIDENSMSKKVLEKSISPIRTCLVNKSVQAKIKSPKEKALTKRNKILTQKILRLNKSVNNMKSLMKIVKSYTENSEIENIISGNFKNICQEFKKNNKNTKPQGFRYSKEVKSFAMTLHFYSPKAYEFLRKYVALPHKDTLRRCLSSFNCNVGFLTEVIQYLKGQIPQKPYLKNVALLFDGMALKQDLSYDQKLDKVFGYVDLGNIVASDSEELATEALVFQIVSYTTYFKCPIAYFFIKNSLSGELLAELLNTAIILLNEIGITVRSMTCDGAPSNIKAYQCLGCSLEQDNLKPYFVHPNGRDKIYCFLDAAHMLKLARNVLAEYPIQSPSGTTSYGCIRELNNVQKEEGLKFGNKLTSTHVEFQNKKMNVKLAAQVLSSSVAEAIEFLRKSGNPLFLDSEATVEFLRIIDRIFDVMNSKSPFGRGFQSPMSLQNKTFWEPIFEETKEYLKTLSINGKHILQHGRKTFALGFLMNIENFPLLLQDLCTDPANPIKYLLTFKCSQDNLEIYFSCIRARGRTNDNPSPLEFRYRLRKLLYRNSVQPSINANCIDHTYEATHVFDNNSPHGSLLESATDNDDTQEIENHLLALDLEHPDMTTEYQKNILYYITGYIVKQIVRRIKCNDCKNMLIALDHIQSDHLYTLDVNKYQCFTVFLNRGKLYFPSTGAYNIVLYADKIFKTASNMDQLNQFNIKNKLINVINQYFTPKLRQMFCHPTNDSINCSELHESRILKLISHSYLNMRLRTHLKNRMDQKLSAIRSKRQKLHKTIIFSHV